MLGKEMRTSNENISYSINLRFIAKKKQKPKVPRFLNAVAF